MTSIKETMAAVAKRSLGIAIEQVGKGFNRADELGGDLRDYLLSREDQPLFRKLGERMARLGGVNLEEDEVSPYEEDVAAATASAPPPTAAEVADAAAKKGLGDEEIAAQIYGRKSCPWTGRAITLLNTGKVDFDFIDMDDSENGQYEGKLVAETKQSTVPYVYLRGEFVGGYNELNEVVRIGQLDYRILSAADKLSKDAIRQRVEIAARPEKEKSTSKSTELNSDTAN